MEVYEAQEVSETAVEPQESPQLTSVSKIFWNFISSNFPFKRILTLAT